MVNPDYIVCKNEGQASCLGHCEGAGEFVQCKEFHYDQKATQKSIDFHDACAPCGKPNGCGTCTACE